MRRMHTFTLAALATFALACSGGEDSTGPDGSTDVTSPVGTFTLATVNGTNVPMLWHEIDVGVGVIRSYWTGGKLVVKSDSTFTVSYSHKLTGPGLAGDVKTDNVSGTWRLQPGGKLEMTTAGGKVIWQTNEQIYTITVNTHVPALEGGTELVIFNFVRN